MRTTTLTLALLLAAPAYAGDGDSILVELDKKAGNFTDNTITFDVANMKPGTTKPAAMSFKTLVKGAKSYTEFLAPGDVKGTRILSTSPVQMWIYLPEFGKVRKVASHNLSQGFMGTTLTSQDIGTTAFAPDYDATIVSKSDTEIVLDLVAKDPDAMPYDKMQMTVDAKLTLPTKIVYKGDDGSAVRTQTREGYSCPSDDFCFFSTLKVVDHTREGAWTELRVVDFEVDTGLSESLFTPRTLQLGL